MANYDPNKPGHTGAALTMRTPAGASLTDTVTNDGLTCLNFVNTGSQMTVTIVASTASDRKCSHGFAHNITVTVPAASGNVWIGGIPPDRFNDDDGRLTIQWPASVTGLTFAALSPSGTQTGIA